MNAPVMRLADAGLFSPNLLDSWESYENGFEPIETKGEGGQKVLYRIENRDSRSCAGMYQKFDAPPLGTYVAGARSKAYNVERHDGTEICSYSIAAKLTFPDGKTMWYQSAYTPGSHDWEYREFSFTITIPAARMEFFCMLKDPFTGIALFDDITLRRGGDRTVVTFGGLPVEAVHKAPDQPEKRIFKTRDGLAVGWGDSIVTSLQIDGRSIMSPAYSGFLVRDIAETGHTGFYAVEPAGGESASTFSGVQPQLGLTVSAQFSQRDDHIAVDGVIRDSRAAADGRCIQLSFVLPVSAEGWSWGTGIHSEQPIHMGRSSDVYRDLGVYIGKDCIKPGSEETHMTVWDWDSEPRTLSPVASVACVRAGICIAASMEFPQYYILEYNGSTGQYVITFLLGIVPQAPDAARFRFVIYKSDDPQWGFRAALEKYTRIYPEAYRVRERNHGLWVPSVDIEAVEGFEDFNFRFKQEGGYYQRIYGAFEKEHGIRGLQYIEPGDWWCRNMTVERTEENIREWIGKLAEGEDSETTRQAIANAFCQNHNQDGNLSWVPTDVPWSRNGAQVHVNANPALPGKYNFYTVYLNDQLWNKLYHPDEPGIPFDGVYLDEISGWWNGNANFNTAHYAYTTVPLTYSPYYKKPMLHRASTTWEFVKKLSDKLRGEDKMIFANKCPDKDNFYTPLADGMGTEMTALDGKEYAPQTIEQLGLWRTYAYQKPYCILLSNDYSVFDHEMVSLYFQRCLAFGIFMTPYDDYQDWVRYFDSRKKTYNRDRDIWLKYMPLLKRISEAGWEPVTMARSGHPDVLVERFGCNPETGLYFTVYNNAKVTRTAHISIENPALLSGGLWELTEQAEADLTGNRLKVIMNPGQTLLFSTIQF